MNKREMKKSPAANLQPQQLLLTTEKCTVGCPVLDHCLGGGIPCKSITEIVAESGSGKTQFCLQLVLSAQLPPSQGGLSASSLYIYTEFPFPIRRLKQLSRYLLSTHPDLNNTDPLTRVFLRGVDSADKLFDIMPEIEMLLCYWKSRLVPIKVIVIDSIAALFRSDFENNVLDLRKRSSLFFKISGKLKVFAERFGLVVVVTNQVVDLICEEEGEGLNGVVRIGNLKEGLYSSGRRVCAALGLAWANCVNSRVFLSREGDDGVNKMRRRRLDVVFAPHLPHCSCEFLITGEGVFGRERNM